MLVPQLGRSAGTHSQAGRLVPQPGGTAGSAGAHFQAGSVNLLQPGRSEGSAGAHSQADSTRNFSI